METRSAFRWTAKTREGAAASSPEIAAEVAEAAAAIVDSVFSGARLDSIEIGGVVWAARSGAGAAGASRGEGASGPPESLAALAWVGGFSWLRRSFAMRNN